MVADGENEDECRDNAQRGLEIIDNAVAAMLGQVAELGFWERLSGTEAFEERAACTENDGHAEHRKRVDPRGCLKKYRQDCSPETRVNLRATEDENAGGQ